MIVVGFLLLVSGLWLLMMRGYLWLHRWWYQRPRVYFPPETITPAPRVDPPVPDVWVDPVVYDMALFLPPTAPIPTVPPPWPPPAASPVDVPWEHWADQWARRLSPGVRHLADG